MIPFTYFTNKKFYIVKKEIFNIGATDYHLKKASSKRNGIAELEGILATQSVDTEGETLFIKGLDISLLNTGYAQINWWHQGKQDPGKVVGFIDEAHKTNNDTEVHFKGHLINVEAGRKCYDLMQAMEEEGKKIGVSVEGAILLKEDSKIYKAIAHGAALATQQINKECTASLMKALNIYHLDKALGVEGNAPYNQNPCLTTNLGLLSFEEAIESLKKEYKNIDEDFLKYYLNKFIKLSKDGKH